MTLKRDIIIYIPSNSDILTIFMLNIRSDILSIVIGVFFLDVFINMGFDY